MLDLDILRVKDTCAHHRGAPLGLVAGWLENFFGFVEPLGAPFRGFVEPAGRTLLGGFLTPVQFGHRLILVLLK